MRSIKIRTEARPLLSQKKKISIEIFAVIIAIVASMIVIGCMGKNPLKVYQKIIEGSLGNFYRFKQTINKTIPLVVLGLGTCMAFKMKFWNIGGEGQFYMGAFAATWVVMAMPDLPAFVMIPLMMIAGFVFGGLLALIPVGLKVKWGTSETLVTLMLNYIAQKWVSFLKYSYLPWRDPHGGGSPKIANFGSNAIMPNVFGIHMGWIIALVLVVIIFLVLKRTKFGYEMSVIGESIQTAKYAGINVNRTMIFAILISGGLCGLAGMIQASAIEHSLTDNMSNGMGFMAVITTWLSQLNPIVNLVVSFLFSMLLQGGSFLQTSMNIPASMGNIIQTIIIFFVLGSEFFVRYKLVFDITGKNGEKIVIVNPFEKVSMATSKVTNKVINKIKVKIGKGEEK
ncbi:MAG: ABC transporter permease [Treponemataceae bacterium]|nr:ABC transporter permease [Treponemataceae bacterium]